MLEGESLYTFDRTEDLYQLLELGSGAGCTRPELEGRVPGDPTLGAYTVQL